MSGAAHAAAQFSAAGALTMDLPSSRAHYRDRIAHAAEETLAQYERWLGPLPRRPIAIAAASQAPTEIAPGAVNIRLPWLTADSTMEIEQEVAFAIAMQYWRIEDNDAGMAEGLAQYLGSRVVERLFNLRYARPGHSAVGARWFGGAVPWAFPALRSSRWSSGVLRDRHAVGFAALERYLSWPVLQGGLRTLAATMADAPLTRDHARAVLSAAAGQDLTWFFGVAFEPTVHVDYAVTSVATAPIGEGCGAPDCHRTRVVVARVGDGAFSGSSRPAVGEFEAGAGVELRVDFADGQQSLARWDGRARERVFEFDAAAPAVSARLDPSRSLLLDPTPLDHVRYVRPATNVPVVKWVALWFVWLQDAMLTYTAIV